MSVNAIIALFTAILAGICVGNSRLLQMQRPQPGWLIAGGLSVWLTILYLSAGQVT